MSAGKVLGVILETVGGLGDTFCYLLGSWKKACNLMIFQGRPGRYEEVGGKKLDPWAQKHQQNQDYQSCCLEILRILVHMTRSLYKSK